MTIKKPLTTLQKILLAVIAVVALSLLTVTALTGKSVKRDCYSVQVAAAMKMQECMDRIKEEKQALGIELSEEDRFETGLIGEEFNFITTTQGDIGAKRTSTSTDMAALMVVMLQEAGLKAGDCLGCSFSGSFPAFNIAVICACDALDITPVYMCSVGASTWGANNEALSFPEMAHILYSEGLISCGPVLVSPGGGDDMGKGVDSDLFEPIWERVKALGYETLENENFAENVSYRKELFSEYEIDAFICVGGNITALGKNMVVDLIGQGIIEEPITSLNNSSGLLENYIYEGTPTMLILNIRQLMADYGLQFDPRDQAVIGEGNIYFETEYSVVIPVAILAFFALFLVVFKKTNSFSKALS